jgi:plastocyanin
MSNSLARRMLVAAGVATLLAGAIVTGAVAQQLLAAPAAQQTAAAGSAEIDIKNFAFEPVSLTVAAGTKVTWVNQDEEPHNIVSLDGQQPHLFRSEALDGGGDTYSFVFDKPGTYRYICSVHPHMQGTITVQ